MALPIRISGVEAPATMPTAQLPFDDGVVRAEASASNPEVIRLTLMTSPPSIGIFTVDLLVRKSAQQRERIKNRYGDLFNPPFVWQRHGRGMPSHHVWVMSMPERPTQTGKKSVVKPAAAHLDKAVLIAHQAIDNVAAQMPMHQSTFRDDWYRV